MTDEDCGEKYCDHARLTKDMHHYAYVINTMIRREKYGCLERLANTLESSVPGVLACITYPQLMKKGQYSEIARTIEATGTEPDEEDVDEHLGDVYHAEGYEAVIQASTEMGVKIPEDITYKFCVAVIGEQGFLIPTARESEFRTESFVSDTFEILYVGEAYERISQLARGTGVIPRKEIVGKMPRECKLPPEPEFTINDMTK